MITDTIDTLYRDFKFEDRGDPHLLLINPNLIFELAEYLQVPYLENLTTYHGLDIIIDEDVEVEIHSNASFQARNY